MGVVGRFGCVFWENVEKYIVIFECMVVFDYCSNEVWFVFDDV